MNETEQEQVFAKAVRLPQELWNRIDMIVQAEDTDFSKWARRAFREQIARDKRSAGSEQEGGRDEL